MEKIKFKHLLIIKITFLLFSCSSENHSETDSSDKTEIEGSLSKFIQVSETTDLLSEPFLNFGISEMVVEQKKEILHFSVKKANNGSKNEQQGYQNISINNHNIDLSYYEVILKDEFLSIGDFKITIFNKEPFIVTPRYTGTLSNAEALDDIESNVLLLYLIDLTSNTRNKQSTSNIILKSGCSFWNTWYSVGVGINSAAAMANLEHNRCNDFMNGGDLSEGVCTPIGLPDTTALVDDSFSVATQAFCCDFSTNSSNGHVNSHRYCN